MIVATCGSVYEVKAMHSGRPQLSYRLVDIIDSDSLNATDNVAPGCLACFNLVIPPHVGHYMLSRSRRTPHQILVSVSRISIAEQTPWSPPYQYSFHTLLCIAEPSAANNKVTPPTPRLSQPNTTAKMTMIKTIARMSSKQQALLRAAF